MQGKSPSSELFEKLKSFNFLFLSVFMTTPEHKRPDHLSPHNLFLSFILFLTRLCIRWCIFHYIIIKNGRLVIRNSNRFPEAIVRLLYNKVNFFICTCRLVYVITMAWFAAGVLLEACNGVNNFITSKRICGFRS